MGRAVVLFFLVLAALLIPACASSSVAVDGPPRAIVPSVDGARQIQPPTPYAAIWFEAERCSGLRGDIWAVTWFVVPTGGEKSFPCEAGRCAGKYSIREHAIYLSDHHLTDAEVVRHEALHALGVLGHPAPVFPVCAPRSR